LDTHNYPSPNNFYVDDQGILVSCQNGVVQYERFFPRESIEVIETNTGTFSDAWVTQDGYLISVQAKDRTQWVINKRPRNESIGDINSSELIAGGRRGYVDGLLDQVEMDGATDFVWDGSGYVFADKDNHAIRKLWLDEAPTNIVY
jgi:hypothetical protein